MAIRPALIVFSGCLCFVPGVASCAEEIGGWREFKWNMTEAQSANVAKAPMRAPRDGEFGANQSFDTRQVLAGVEILGKEFNAGLSYCGRNALCRVDLNLVSDLKEDFESEDLFNSLLNSLQQKYGNTRVIRGESAMRKVEARWIVGDTAIVLMRLSFLNTVKLVYEFQKATDDL